MTSAPFFSIITVSRNDAWSLQKTARSVFEQNFDDFEYIIFDGKSMDGSQELLRFWDDHGLANIAVSENDSGVYNAMNKAVRLAKGQFVCFMNAGDVFSDQAVLKRVHEVLCEKRVDGILGWGELNGKIWASWLETSGFKMASLGFCHQALYLRRQLLVDNPFDERSFKTDSDTRQLAGLFETNARVEILQDVLAIRGGGAGISADLVRSAKSIINTLLEEYPGLSEPTAKSILKFRRNCEDLPEIYRILNGDSSALSRHCAYMVLDTLFLMQSQKLEEQIWRVLLQKALKVLTLHKVPGSVIENLLRAQGKKVALLQQRKIQRNERSKEIAAFALEELQRKKRITATLLPRVKRQRFQGVVSLTTFPARVGAVRFSIESLLEQSILPDEIHLWVGRDEFPSRKWLPKDLLSLERHGLQIHFATRTFHQYDKYIHNCRINDSRPFVIVDDDVIYPEDSLAHLVEGHSDFPDSVIANRAHEIVLREDEFAPYSDWRREVSYPRPRSSLLPTGAGGVLYPPGFFLNAQADDVASILACAPYADDIWLKFCSLKSRCPVFATELSDSSRWYHRYTPSMRAGTLMQSNVERGLNDFQVKQCVKWLKSKLPDWRPSNMLQEQF